MPGPFVPNETNTHAQTSRIRRLTSSLLAPVAAFAFRITRNDSSGFMARRLFICRLFQSRPGDPASVDSGAPTDLVLHVETFSESLREPRIFGLSSCARVICGPFSPPDWCACTGVSVYGETMIGDECLHDLLTRSTFLYRTGYSRHRGIGRRMRDLRNTRATIDYVSKYKYNFWMYYFIWNLQNFWIRAKTEK